MNDVTTKDASAEKGQAVAYSNVGIVAVVFHDIDDGTLKLNPQPASTKPYFYLDPVGLEPGDLAGVYSNGKFGLVRAVRKIGIDDPIACQKVSKPILFKVNYDEDLITECMKKLTGIRASSVDIEVHAQIDKALGYNQDGEASAQRRRLIEAQANKKDFD